MPGRAPFTDTAAEWRQYGPHDERPILPREIDPQLLISRVDRDQPFFLICEKDTLIVQMSGSATVEFRQSNVNRFRTTPGDHVYVPARTPHRLMVREEGCYLRYKAREPGLEGVAWYCEACGEEITREAWDAGREIPQAAYLRVVEAFNRSDRLCQNCGSVHPRIDLSGYCWSEMIAEEVAAGEAQSPKAGR